MLRTRTLFLTTGLLCLASSSAQAVLPTVSSANLVAHFQANSSSLSLDGSNNVLSWTAENNPGLTLTAQGTNDPANIRFNSTDMGGLGTIEVNDFSGDNRYLRGELGQGLPNGATIFWTGYYQPGRNGSLGDGSGQYAYTVGKSAGQGTQLDNQIDDGRFELWGGSGTQTGRDISPLNGIYSVLKTTYFPNAPGHSAIANNDSLLIAADGGYAVPAGEDIQLFGWQNSSGAAGGFNFVGNMSDFVLFDGVVDADDSATVFSYLNSRLPSTPPSLPPLLDDVVLYAPLSGTPNSTVPGFVPHGNDDVSGYAKFTINPNNNTMDYEIVVNGNTYDVTQAHFYNINKTSGTSGNPAHGDSIICWGGRWANGGDSDDYLQGTGYVNGRLSEVIANPEDWMLIIHTEGGHFANGEDGGLIEYNPAVHETNELGVPETERPSRFNNRVGRTLLDMVLREDNTRDPNAPFYDPLNPDNMADSPFADSHGNMWVEFDSNAGEYVLTDEAISRGYDLNTEYLFFLYDDQGPTWDFGGPEGAFGGFLTTQQIPEPTSVVIAIGLLSIAAFTTRRCR